MLKETVYPASRKTGVLLLLGSLTFVAIGIVMLSDRPLMAWGCIAFFGLCALTGGAMLLPGVMAIALDAAGFEIRTFGRRNRTAWLDVASFDLVSMHHQEVIGVTYRPGCRQVSQVSRSITGIDGMIPNSYQIPAPRLLAEMQAWRSQYGRPNGS